MAEAKELITGVYSRMVDDRYRLTLPDEFKEIFKPESGKCVIANESPGCLSLWEENTWKQYHDTRVKIVQQMYEIGRVAIPDLQRFGRLNSARYQHIQLADRARFLLPEGFRGILGVEPKKEVMVVGAACCIEIWNPQKWISYIEGDMPQFGNLLENLLNNRTT